MNNDKKSEKDTKKAVTQTVRVLLTPEAVEALLNGFEVEVKIDAALSIKLGYDDKRKKN